MQDSFSLRKNTRMNTNLNDDIELNKAIIKQLNELMDATGSNPTELARLTGIAQPTVHRILSGQSDDPKLSNLRKLARALGTTLSQLEAGTAEPMVKEEAAQYSANTDVPVFNLRDIENGYDQPLFRMPCPVEHSHSTYAAKVHDNTMEASMGPSYPEGSIIFVDPERAAEAQNGDLVVFRLSESGVVGFKRLVDNETVRGLEPLNIRYPMVPQQDFEVIGLVIGCWIN